MTPNLKVLRAELTKTNEALAASDEQVRGLSALLGRAADPRAGIPATDAAKLSTAALAVNQRLIERQKYLDGMVGYAQRQQQFQVKT